MSDARHYGRLTFLAVAAGGLSSIVWGPAASRLLGAVLAPARDLVPTSISNLVAPGWRIYTVGSSMPSFDPATWKLSIEGLVERPLELNYAELRALPRAAQVSDFHCVTGWSVPRVRWAGVRFRDLLAAARPLSSARALTFVSAEKPYADSLSLDEAGLSDVMLAYEMDGRPLSRPHGAPARVVIPEMYGYKDVKWVERIVVTDVPADGYWEQRGYDRDAWVGGGRPE